MRILPVLLTLVFLLNESTLHADFFAASTFDNDADGWLAVELPSPTTGPPYTILNTQNPSWVALGGNPTGYIENSLNTNSTLYWSAPSKFLGDLSSAYGYRLSFDLFDTPSNNQFDQEDVILIGGGRVLVFDNVVNPSANCTNYAISLSESGWSVNNFNGQAATQADMQSVLSNLQAIYIRGEYQLGNDTRGLDNVIITAVPEPSSILLSALFFTAVSHARFRRRNLI